MFPQINTVKIALQNYLVQLLQEKYLQHGPIIERLSHYLVTERDLQEFAGMMGSVYEMAYRRAFLEYKKHLEQYDITLEIETKETNPQTTA